MRIINLKTVLLIIVAVILFQYLGKHNSEFNKKIVLPAGTKILAIGDSITYGYKVPTNQNYPSILSKLLKTKIINAGKIGENSAEGLKRLPSLLEKYKPTILIICYGGNDILKNKSLLKTKENIANMIKLAKKKKIFVVLVGVPKFGILALKTAQFYYDLSSKYNVPLEDEELAWIENNNALKIDRVHPNAAGYKILSSKIAAIITDNYTNPYSNRME